MIQVKKSTQEILQEELLRERAAVLARAGERLEQAHRELQRLEREVEAHIAAGFSAETATAPAGERRTTPLELHAKIEAFNSQRERVRIRLYEFIVTREALGLRHHQRLEEIYRLPPKRRPRPGTPS